MRLATFVLLASAAVGSAADSMKTGKVPLQSAGPIAFGPDGVLFVGDPKASAVFAIATADPKAAATPINLPGLSDKLAGMLGVKAGDVVVNDLAVNPISNAVYLSVSRGKGPDALPVILRADAAGKLTEVSLESIPHAKADIPKPSARNRKEAITGLKYAKGKLYVAGLSNEEFASTLRVLAYPFDGKVAAANVEMYHGAHGKKETASPVRTFAPIEVNGKEEILAAYTCTPLVRISVDELKDGAKVKGTTVAELGNMNKPLDIVVYAQGGKTFALMANSARGVMKVALDGIEKIEPIVSRVNKAGLTYETVSDLKGVEQLDKLGDGHAVLLVRAGPAMELKSIVLP